MKINSKTGLSEQITVFLFFIFYYLYLWLWIQPVLHFQSQQPVFFLDNRFFREFLAYPGGLTEYVALFLSQFFYFSWMGAFIITILAWLLYIQTITISGLLGSTKKWHIVHFIPSLMLLTMHSKYHHSIAISLGVILSLECLIVYIKFFKKRFAYSLILYFSLSAFLYYASAGHFLTFTALCILLELIVRRRLLPAVFYGLSALILPFIAYTASALLNIQDAYFYLLPFRYKYPFSIGPWIMYSMYPIMMISSIKIHHAILSLKPVNNLYSGIQSKMASINRIIKTTVLYIFILIITVIAALASFESEKKNMLQISYYAGQQMWNRVLEIAQHKKPTYILAQYHINRALYHTGQLSEKMFNYSQDWGLNGLILPMAFNKAPLQKSDIYFELGHMNEAHRWAHEALTIIGETPRVLQQLALINIYKGEPKAAQKYCELLKRTLFFRKWARQNESYISNHSLLVQNPRLKRIDANLNRTDFFSNPHHPVKDLEILLDHNPSNKMAFEYLMAAYLLTGQISKLNNRMHYVKKLGYRTIPTPYEEALFIYFLRRNPDLLKEKSRLFHRDTFLRFQKFQKIMATHGNNKSALLADLKNSYSNSYWYYIIRNNLKLK